MKPVQGYYSIIQYCPDPVRLEVANIGIVLFCPSTGLLTSKTTDDNSRIIKFFGSSGQYLKQLDIVRKGIASRLKAESAEIKSLEDLQLFFDRRANEIRFTTPRSVRVLDPVKTRDELFREIVGSEEKAAPIRPRSAKDHLSQLFKSAGVASKVVEDVRVRVPISNRDLHVPFGYQNGRFNLIEPVRFLSASKSSLQQTAFRYAVEGESLFDTSNSQIGPMQLIVVGQFRENDDEAYNSVKNILEPHQVKLFSEQWTDGLLRDIAVHGKPAPPWASKKRETSIFV